MGHDCPQNFHFFKVIIMTDYPISNSPAISASGVIQDATFHRHKDPESPGFYWFVRADVENKADFVFYGSPNTIRSEGMGGRIIPFTCTDGEIIHIQGPWWASARSFKKSTGIDITDQHISFVVVSRSIDHTSGRPIMKDVLYQDPGPVIGPDNRTKAIMKHVFDTVEVEKIAVYHKGYGGSSYGYYSRGKNP